MSQTRIWIPSTRGEVDVRVWRVNLAVKDYDERLSIGRNENTGDWCVYISRGPGLAPHPVLGLGPEMPTDVHRVMQRIVEADTARYGTEILRGIEQSQDKVADAKDKILSDSAWVAAEAFEYLLRRQGKTPYARVSMNGPTRKGYGEWF